MKDPVLDFLRTALIPELRPNIAARSAGNGHLRLIMIATIGAFPDELTRFIFDNLDFAVVAANFTIIALCIELCIHNIIVNIFHDCQDSRYIVLHIRYFYVADGAARRQPLEVRFKFQFMECIDFSVTCT